MSDRLKQIWGGFEQTTERRLTGRGIDNVHVPHRRDWRADDEQLLPEGFTAPSAAAFAALKEKLSDKHKRSFMKNAKRKTSVEEPQNLEQMLGPDEAAFDRSQSDLIRGLKATEMRTERPQISYVDEVALNGGRPLKKRKKIFGIF